MHPRLITMFEVLRYARGADPADTELDGYPNYHYVTSWPGRESPKLKLDAGINAAAHVESSEGPRRPVIALRTSPLSAGSAENPWHDEFDLDNGRVRYYGDHKPSTEGTPGMTKGNKALFEAWSQHSGTSEQNRALAPPLLLFRSTPVERNGRKITTGYVEFCGLAIIERLEHVEQQDANGRTFPNIALDLVILDLSDMHDALDMRWVDDRRDPSLTAAETIRRAPKPWKQWVREGRSAFPQIRRRVAN